MTQTNTMTKTITKTKTYTFLMFFMDSPCLAARLQSQPGANLFLFWLNQFSMAVSVFEVILAEFDKYCTESETSRLV